MTETIEVPYFRGYTCLGWKVPKKGEYLLRNGVLLLSVGHLLGESLVYEKLPPKRHVFEETGECRELHKSEYGLDTGGNIFHWEGEESTDFKYTVLKKIE